MKETGPKRTPSAAPYHHGNLKEALIEEGLKIIATEGVTRLSLRKVARNLKVSHGAPYSHFKNKDELLAAITEQGYHLFFSGLQQRILKTYNSDYEMVSNLLHYYLSFAVEQPDYYRLVFGNGMVDLGAYPPLVARIKDNFNMMHMLISAFIDKGSIKADDSYMLTIQALSTLHGYCMLVIDGRLKLIDQAGEDPHENLENLVRKMWTGFGGSF